MLKVALEAPPTVTWQRTEETEPGELGYSRRRFTEIRATGLVLVLVLVKAVTQWVLPMLELGPL